MLVREVPGLFDTDVIVLECEVSAEAVAHLRPREAKGVDKAVDKRRREYATGRYLAREALGRLGVTDFDLLNGEDRAPIWPEGISGTITHSDRRVLVGVGQTAAIGTIGLDIEHRDGLKRDLFRMTMLDEEIRYLSSLPEDRVEPAALLLFSAKEALYKAQYPRSSTYMGFHALRVELVPDPERPLKRGELRCIFQKDVAPFPRGTVAVGRYRPFDGEDGEVVSAVRIPS